MARPLFPSDTVPDGKKAKAVYAICRRTGYGWDEETQDWDPAAWAWWDTATESGNVADPSYAAAEAHYDATLTTLSDSNPLVLIYKGQINRDRSSAAVEPEF